MLDIFNHLAVFGILFVIIAAIAIFASEDISFDVIFEGFKCSCFIMTACEILVWSIWYLRGGFA